MSMREAHVVVYRDTDGSIQCKFYEPDHIYNEEHDDILLSYELPDDVVHGELILNLMALISPNGTTPELWNAFESIIAAAYSEGAAKKT